MGSLCALRRTWLAACSNAARHMSISLTPRSNPVQQTCAAQIPLPVAQSFWLSCLKPTVHSRGSTVLTQRFYCAQNSKLISKMSLGRVLVYGGKGALGDACVSHFKANNFWVGSIDLSENEHADLSIVVPRDESWVKNEQSVLEQVGAALQGEQLDAVICVAGGWAGGNAKKDLAKNSELMWRQSVWTSTISATIAANYLKEGGLLALTGAKPALQGTPGMIGYGMAKAAVHQLTRSLAGKDSGLPSQAVVVAILPVTLDTPMNRKWMPNADFSTWTTLTEVAELFSKWTKGVERPMSGALLQLITKDSVTSLLPVDE